MAIPPLALEQHGAQRFRTMFGLLDRELVLVHFAVVQPAAKYERP